MIDCGSSDNFIQPRIARSLKYPIEPVPAFKVMVDNGNYMSAEGRIKELIIKTQGNSFTFPVFLLPISGADLIFEASWLKTIGPHIADYGELRLQFLYNDKFTVL